MEPAERTNPAKTRAGNEIRITYCFNLAKFRLRKETFKSTLEVSPGWQRSTKEPDRENLVIFASASNHAVWLKNQTRQHTAETTLTVAFGLIRDILFAKV